MPQSDTGTFDSFNSAFAAPPGETLRLEGMGVVVYADYRRDPARCPALRLEQRILHDCKMPEIELRQRDGKPALFTTVNGTRVYAKDWLDLADQLAKSGKRVFPEAILTLFKQVGGDASVNAPFKMAF